MDTVTARIESVEDGEGLWLLIDGNPVPDDTYNLFKVARYAHMDESGTILPIMPEEVAAVRDACQEWLDKQGEIEAVANRVLDTDTTLDDELDAIFDIEPIKCDHATNPAGRPTGKHYSDFDIFRIKDQLKALIKQYQEAA